MPTLTWLTRENDIKLAQKAPCRLLEPVPELSHGDPDSGNLLIQGDNLEALKTLLPFYARKVKCIYIDPHPGELKPDGEEFECARILDSLPQVKYWVRNIEGSQFSFKLPTSTYNFYPDFVAELNDGRILVVEYNGAHLIDKKSEVEKLNIGQLWEEKSNGKGLFLMAEKKDPIGRDVFKQMMDKMVHRG